MYVENWQIYRRLFDWGYALYPQSYKRLLIFLFSTYISSAITPEILKLCRVTKIKMFFLMLVYVFNFDLLEFLAAILEKGLLVTSECGWFSKWTVVQVDLFLLCYLLIRNVYWRQNWWRHKYYKMHDYSIVRKRTIAS